MTLLMLKLARHDSFDPTPTWSHSGIFANCVGKSGGTDRLFCLQSAHSNHLLLEKRLRFKPGHPRVAYTPSVGPSSGWSPEDQAR